MFENVIVQAAARQRELLLPDRRRLLAAEAQRGMPRRQSWLAPLAVGWLIAGVVGGAWGLVGVAVVGVAALPIAARLSRAASPPANATPCGGEVRP